MSTQRHILALLSADSAEKIYGPEVRKVFSSYSWSDPFRHDGDWKRATEDDLEQCQIILGGWGSPCLDSDLLSKIPNLELVLYGAGTVRSITSDAFWDRQIPICSAVSANAIPVADFTLAQIILGLKQAFQTVGLHHGEKHTRIREIPYTRTYQAKVGIVSLGNIGRLVAERLQPFDLEVFAYDPFVSRSDADRLGVNMVDLDTLFKTCDAVSVNTPELPETFGLIGYPLLASMPRGSVFINTSRGSVINEPEMIRALTERPDIQALLDVTFPEPAPPDSPLRKLPNVFLTPHISGSHGRECHRMGYYMQQDLENYLAGRPLSYQISHTQFLRSA